MMDRKLIRFGVFSAIVAAIVVACLGALAIQTEKQPPPIKKRKSQLYLGLQTPPIRSASTVTGSRHHYDFKTVLQGDTLEHDFSLPNASDRPLALTRVKGGWGLIVTASPRQILPGETGVISVLILTDTYGGETLAPKVLIETDDPNQPNIVIEGRLVVEKFADITPFEILLTGSHKDPLVGEATVFPADKYPFNIVRIKTKKGRGFDCRFEEVAATSRRGYRIIVTNTLPGPGAYRDMLFVETDHPKRPEVKIRVRGSIQ